MWYRCFHSRRELPGQLAHSAALVEIARPVGAQEPVGFFVTRFVEADSAEQAEQKALLLLRSEPKLAPPEGSTPTGLARVFFDEISEVRPEAVPDPQPGIAFYPMESTRAQQRVSSA